MRKSNLYRLAVRSLLEVEGGPSTGAKYSMRDACRVCGTGAVRLGPLRLRLGKHSVPKIACTLDGEIIVGLEVHSALVAQGVTCTGPVLEAVTGDPLACFELCCQALLPPFSDQTTGYTREKQCQVCGRDGYFNVPKVKVELVYPRLDDDVGGKHVLCTYERFGNSSLRSPFSESVFARPLYIVSRTVKDVLCGLRLREAEFQPVNIMQDN